jgi:hypothetical protein
MKLGHTAHSTLKLGAKAPFLRACAAGIWLALASCGEPAAEDSVPDVGPGAVATADSSVIVVEDATTPDLTPTREAGVGLDAGTTRRDGGASAADATTGRDGNLPTRDASPATPDASDRTPDAATSGGDARVPDAAVGSVALVPAQGVLLGQYYGDGNVAQTTTKLGRTLPVHLVYYTFTDDWTRGNTTTDLSAGRIPLVNWELFETKLDDIIAGKFDTMLTERARAAKALGKPFFLDFGAEMNGDWSPWGGAQNGSNATKYLAAYKRVHDAFTQEAASNVVWIWCPNVTDEPSASWNQALNYYPGDDYVDWTCVDGYNWGSSNGGGWQSFRDVFKNIYAKLASKGKPIMIGEMASAEVGGDKAAWIAQIVPTLRADYPLIKGLIWFDVNKETDWRISSSAKTEAAFKAFAADPYTNP